MRSTARSAADASTSSEERCHRWHGIFRGSRRRRTQMFGKPGRPVPDGLHESLRGATWSGPLTRAVQASYTCLPNVDRGRGRPPRAGCSDPHSASARPDIAGGRCGGEHPFAHRRCAPVRDVDRALACAPVGRAAGRRRRHARGADRDPDATTGTTSGTRSARGDRRAAAHPGEPGGRRRRARGDPHGRRRQGPGSVPRVDRHRGPDRRGAGRRRTPHGGGRDDGAGRRRPPHVGGARRCRTPEAGRDRPTGIARRDGRDRARWDRRRNDRHRRLRPAGDVARAGVGDGRPVRHSRLDVGRGRRASAVGRRPRCRSTRSRGLLARRRSRRRHTRARRPARDAPRRRQGHDRDDRLPPPAGTAGSSIARRRRARSSRWQATG